MTALVLSLKNTLMWVKLKIINDYRLVQIVVK